MTKQEILQYVLDTPHNTNVTILEQKIDEYVGENSSVSGGEKILYMNAALLNAGGAYPVDTDDYTTAVIPAEATFVSLEAFANLPEVRTITINGDCEFELYEQVLGMSTVYVNGISKHYIPVSKLTFAARTEDIPAYFMRNVGTMREVNVSGSISEAAFEYCSYLKKATLENCTSIGMRAFCDCYSLAEVTIPDGVTSIEGGAFCRCYKLTNVTLPDSLTTIGNNAFGQSGLTEITIPAGVATISDYAFNACKNLTEITIPAGVASIGSNAFGACTNLTKITILGKETTIADSTSIPSTAIIRGYSGSKAEMFAFVNGNTFESIDGGPGIQPETLYMDAELLNAGGAYPADTSKLYDEVVIPADATFVSLEAFNNLPYVKTLTVNGDCEFETYEDNANTKDPIYLNAITKNGVPINKLTVKDRTQIPAYFMRKVDSLKEIDVSGSIGDYAFYVCSNLKSITLSNCESIGWCAFYMCTSLTEVIIPDGVTNISNGAFNGCSNLREVTIPATISDIWYSSLFYDCGNLATITILGMDTILNYDFPTTVTIRGYAGSAAETFANENGNPFEVIE